MKMPKKLSLSATLLNILKIKQAKPSPQSFMSHSPRRVVVTGLGLISPLGTGLPKNWDALSHGRSGIDRIKKFNPERLPTHIAGEVRDLDLGRYLDVKEARRYDPYIH